MAKSASFFIILLILVTACRNATPASPRLNVVLFGYDSLAWYYGDSMQVPALCYGKLTDKGFMDHLMATALHRRPDTIFLKPGGGGGVLSNWELVEASLKARKFANVLTVRLDEQEEYFFNTNSVLDMFDQRP